jgi:peptidoglycan/xylan/chitin deacetylase (PgdA/CDA1 family)
LTPIVLKILAENNAKATFFLLGQNIAGHQSIVRQIVADGHEVCSHGYKHMHYWMVSPFRALTDIKKGRHAINAALGKDKRGKYPFRPPHGKLNLVCLVYLLLHRVPIIYWSLDVGDTWPPSYQDKNRVALLIKKTGGAVTLAHDFDRSDSSMDNIVSDSIRLALATARQYGLCTLTVSQLLGLEK